MQGLNKRMREAKLEEGEPVSMAQQVKTEEDIETPVKKEEDMDDSFAAALAKQQQALAFSDHGPAGSPPSSPLNSVQPRWTKAIVSTVLVSSYSSDNLCSPKCHTCTARWASSLYQNHWHCKPKKARNSQHKGQQRCAVMKRAGMNGYVTATRDSKQTGEPH
jgi:hypothetical protein